MTDVSILDYRLQPGEVPCIAYAVKSSPDETESVSDQHRRVVTAIGHEGGRRLIARPFGEERASGYLRERGRQLDAAMAAAIDAAERYGEAELWVFHSSRLGRGDGRRRRRSLALIHALLRYQGVQLRSADSTDDAYLQNPMLVGIASEQNHKFSADMEAHIRRGKAQRREAGKIHGGPVQDGYARVPERDESGEPIVGKAGKIIYKRVIDPNRRPVIERIADMLERGSKPGQVAKALNRDGIRTVRGLEWTTRRIRETIHNHYYSGYIESRKYGLLIKGVHEPILDRERHLRILSSLQRLDPVAVQARTAGRTSSQADAFFLRGVAFCGYCGHALYIIPAKKDTHRRRYECGRKRSGSGTCDAPRILAGVAEAQVLARLKLFVGDVEQWIAQRAQQVDTERVSFEAAVDEQRAALAKLARRLERARAQHDDALDSDDDALAAVALRQVARVEREHDDLSAALRSADARLSEWPKTNADTALDYYAGLRRAIDDRVSAARSVLDLNAALRSVLEGVWLRIVKDADLGDVLFLEFVLVGPEDGRPEIASIATKVDHWTKLLDGDLPIVPSTDDPGTVIEAASVSGVPLPPLRVPVGQKGAS